MCGLGEEGVYLDIFFFEKILFQDGFNIRVQLIVQVDIIEFLINVMKDFEVFRLVGKKQLIYIILVY